MARTTTLPIFIADSSGRTLQQQIYDSIRRSILEGLIAADRRLPSTRALAADLGVSRTTVLLALEHLQAEGYLVARRGSGTFVATDLPDRSPVGGKHEEAARVSRPPFSVRGRALSQSRAPDRRILGPPRAFRLGTPALDLFPHRIWSRIARECVRTARPQHLDYSTLTGLLELREAIAEQVQARGTRCDPSQVHVVNGAQHGLDLIFRMLLDVGDKAWMEDPGYTGARSALLAAGALPVPVPVDAHGMVIASDRRDDDNVRLAYVTPSHQFPSGVALSLERRHQLLEWARASHAWIVEDDYDCDFRYRAQPLPCLHALDPDGRVIYLGSFSKTLFPALRLGFLIVPRDLSAGFAAARLASDLHSPVLEQSILAQFMLGGHYQRHLRRMQAAYAERLGALQQSIEQSGAPLRLRPVHSGLHAVADVEGVDATQLHREAAAQGIETMPFAAYQFGATQPDNALLLGFAAVKPAAIRLAVTQLARAIETVAARQPFVTLS